MKTFTTTGTVQTFTNPDGTIRCYKVGRLDMGAIELHRDIPEYHKAGNMIHIDKHGNPWVRK